MATSSSGVVGRVDVFDRRSALGIAASVKRRWTSEEDALLGTDDDEVIAAKIGRTPMSVMLAKNGQQPAILSRVADCSTGVANVAHEPTMVASIDLMKLTRSSF